MIERRVTNRAPLRVLLVSLPFRYFPRARKGSINYSRPPLGIAYLAAYLRQHADFPVDVRCLDLLTEVAASRQQIRDRILALEPDIVGFSVLTASQPTVAWLAPELKSARPELVIACGGPHITAMPEEAIEGVDARIVGEGELALLEFIEQAVLGDSDSPIPGVVRTLDGGQIQNGGRRPLIEDLDQLPLPARDLLPNERYLHSFPYRGVTGFTTMMTARGCPYDCNFCANAALWGRRVRTKSIDRVLAEVDQVTSELAINLIFFDDDTFTANPDRAQRLMARLRRRHPTLRWICHTRVDSVDEALVAEMAASGCVEVQLGIESGDDGVLASTNKRIDLGQAERTLKLFRARGINTWATFVLGHELETRATLARTAEAARRLNPTYASFIVLLPFPGSAVYQTFRDKGYLTTDDWADYSWHGDPVFATDHLSAEDLVVARRSSNLAFYLRPRKLFELGLHTVRAASVQEMARNFWAWLSLVAPQR